MKSNRLLINHIKKYSTFEWLLFIKILENQSGKDLFLMASNEFERSNLENPNWYLIIIDLAVRFADEQKTKVSSDLLPTKEDYMQFISLYVDCSDDDSNFVIDLNISVEAAFAQYGYEQLKPYSPIANSVGRLIDLYENKEILFKDQLGLSPKQILYFALIHNSPQYRKIYEPFDLNSMLRLLQQYDSKISLDRLKKFLSIFSITIKNYKLKSKELGNTKDKIKTIRLIEQFSIIALENNHYFIPSINALTQSLTYKMFFTLENIQQNREKFKRSFGKPFEDYTRRLTQFSHADCFFECDQLITQDNCDKAEYYLSKNDSTIVIECKLLPVNEVILLNGKMEEIEDILFEKIKKAIRQISSCFEYISTKNKFGIIVIYTHFVMPEAYFELLKRQLKYDCIDNIKILSIVDYENLIHDDFNTIIEFLMGRQKRSKLQQPNKYLRNKVYSLLNELKQTLKNKELH